MRQTFAVKAIYIAALFAIAFLAIAVRLYSMQVDGDSDYRNGAKNVRTRRVAFFPSRARILDRDGNILADNRSEWDVHGDFWALLSPANYLKRQSAYASFQEDQAAALSYYQKEIEPVLDGEFESPARPRKFFALWELRQSTTLKADRQELISLLALALHIDAQAVEEKVSLVEDEVNALYQLACDGEISLGRAYLDAKRALRDGEYWMDIIRFPKAIRLEGALVERIELSDAMSIYFEVLAETIEQDPSNRKKYIRSAIDKCKTEATHFAPKKDEHQDLLTSFVPFEAWPTDQSRAEATRSEAFKFWKSMQKALMAIDNELAHESLMQGLQYLSATEEEAYQIRDRLHVDFLNSIRAYRRVGIEERITKLRARIYQGDADHQSYRSDYAERWISYLNYTETKDARLQANPLLIARRISRPAVEALKLHTDKFDGLSFHARSERLIIDPKLMPHLLGTLSKPTPENIDEVVREFSQSPTLKELLESEFYGDTRAFERAFRGTVAEHPIGISGVEGYYDRWLAGQPGGRSSSVDARGRTREIVGEWNSIPSEDLTLTIDSDTQRFTLETFEKYESIFGKKIKSKAARKKTAWTGIEDKWSLRGAFVMIDVETGGIISMVSYPSYDPELLASSGVAGDTYRDLILKGGDEKDWPKRLHFLRKTPMFDRAVGAKHAPGSTMKVLTAIAALEEGVIDENFTYDDSFKVHEKTNVSVGAHREYKHVNVVEALAASLNGFFYELTVQMPGRNPSERYRSTFLPWLKKFGFGEEPGLDIKGPQSRGNLPPLVGLSKEGFAMASIGQGKVEASLLQVARFYSAIATKGYLPTPHLVKQGEHPRRYVEVSDRTWELVHKGLRGAVESTSTGDRLSVNGTARKEASLKRINAIGKTGTAEVGYWFDENGEKHRKPDHAWFAGFAPRENPKVAFVALAEYSGLYGSDVGSLCGDIAEFWLKKEAAKTLSDQTLVKAGR